MLHTFLKKNGGDASLYNLDCKCYECTFSLSQWITKYKFYDKSIKKKIILSKDSEKIFFFY